MVTHANTVMGTHTQLLVTANQLVHASNFKTRDIVIVEIPADSAMVLSLMRMPISHHQDVKEPLVFALPFNQQVNANVVIRVNSVMVMLNPPVRQNHVVCASHGKKVNVIAVIPVDLPTNNLHAQ